MPRRSTGSEVLRILRAFAWLRWRILINSLERFGSRDVVERFSLAIEQLAPTIVALVMIPSAGALAGIAAYAGWSLAQGEQRVILFELLRYLLLGACVFAIVGPILLPVGDRTNAVRFLLLPIPRGVLYLAQGISALADPWVVLVAAIVFALPLGLGAGGNLGAAAVGILAGILFLVVLAGIGLMVTTLVHLAVRDRRRGEILTLVFFLLIPAIGMLPGLIDGGRRHRAPSTPVEERVRNEPPAWWTMFERTAMAIVPSETYVLTTRTAAQRDWRAATPPLLTLVAAAAALHGLALAVFVRVLNSPGIIGSARAGSKSALSRWGVPGVSPGTSAVALNQLRLALRTPRGRSTVLSPIVVFLMFAALMLRSQTGGMEFGLFRFESGMGLASFGSFVSLLTILPLAMNQFAIDRAGLTLTLLTPLGTRTLLAGKALGNALVAAIPVAICFFVALVLFPSGHPALWLSIPVALVATYLLVAPVAAVLSALFPRAVDLNSIGRGSNAHGAAGLLGTLAFAAAGVPNLLLVLLATRVFDRSVLAPVFLIAWAALCAAVSAALFRVAESVFERRRENLAQVA